jgi:hypothetical protein
MPLLASPDEIQLPLAWACRVKNLNDLNKIKLHYGCEEEVTDM